MCVFKDIIPALFNRFFGSTDTAGTRPTQIKPIDVINHQVLNEQGVET